MCITQRKKKNNKCKIKEKTEVKKKGWAKKKETIIIK